MSWELLVLEVEGKGMALRFRAGGSVGEEKNLQAGEIEMFGSSKESSVIIFDSCQSIVMSVDTRQQSTSNQ